MMERAYSLLTVTKADADQRIIEGLASDSQTDKVGDQVISTGARFKLPLPLLMDHRHSEPIGHVIWADAKPDGVRFRAQLVEVKEPGPLRDRLQTAWQGIKAGLWRGVSIGFTPIKAEPIASGVRFLEWSWHELSVCVVPCNQAATIQTVKALAQRKPTRVVRLRDDDYAKAGVKRTLPVVRLNQPSTVTSDRPVADAIKAEITRQNELAEERQRRKDLGPMGAMMVDMLKAGTVATDKELADLRRRLDALEGKRR